MTATYTFDVFSTLDGFGSPGGGDWGGYWGKQGPEFLEHRLAQYSEKQRMVLGASTYRMFAGMLATFPKGSEIYDPWVSRMLEFARQPWCRTPWTNPSTGWTGPLPRATPSTSLPGSRTSPTYRSALARQHLAQPRSAGRRSGRPGPGDGLPGPHRSDRSEPGLPRHGRLRSRVARVPDPRRQHPRTHLSADPARPQVIRSPLVLGVASDAER